MWCRSFDRISLHFLMDNSRRFMYFCYSDSCYAAKLWYLLVTVRHFIPGAIFIPQSFKLLDFCVGGCVSSCVQLKVCAYLIMCSCTVVIVSQCIFDVLY